MQDYVATITNRYNDAIYDDASRRRHYRIFVHPIIMDNSEFKLGNENYTDKRPNSLTAVSGHLQWH